MSEPTLAELLTAVQAVPPIEPNTREDGEGTEHDIVHQLELDALAALLAFADDAEGVLQGLDGAVGSLGGRLDTAEGAISSLDGRVQALEEAPGGAGGVAVEDEGTPLGSGPATTLNFTGAGVTATRIGDVVTVDVPGGTAGAITRSITVGFDGGSVDGTPESVRVGQLFELRLPWALELTRWTLLPQSGATGDITLAVRTRPFDSGSYSSITASAPPATTGGARADSSTLTGWTTSLAAGALLQVEITARTGLVPGITLILEGTQA